MEGSEGEEAYQDIASDETVRPSLLPGGGNSPSGPREGEPEYHLFRDESTVGVDMGVLLGNPNLGMTDEGNALDNSRRLMIECAGVGKGHHPDEAADPPYEHMTLGSNSGSQDIHGSSVIREAHPSKGGKGIGTEAGSQSLGNSRRTVPERTGSGLEHMIQPELVLNGTAPRVGVAARRERREYETEIAGDSQNSGCGDSALEALVARLLQQNAALQQELLESKMSSGSGSNVSQEFRSEGRGMSRGSASGSGVHRKGKGIGSECSTAEIATEPGRVFRPPWTSFAVSPDYRSAQPAQDERSRSGQGTSWSTGLPPESSERGAPAETLITIRPHALHPSGFGDVFAPPMSSSVPKGGKPWNLENAPAKSYSSEVVGPCRLMNLQDDNVEPTQASQSWPDYESDRLALRVHRWTLQEQGDNSGEHFVRHNMLRAPESNMFGLAAGNQAPSSTSTTRHDPECQVAPSQEKGFGRQQPRGPEAMTDNARFCPPPPSVSELEQPGRGDDRKPPPLPRFAYARDGYRSISLMVDGKRREVFVDKEGRIQVVGPAHFSIGSDDEADARHNVGEPAMPTSPNPFTPGASSPFRQPPSGMSEQLVYGCGTDVSQPPVPPPPPIPEAWTRGSRRRTPSPRTPSTKRVGWGTLSASPATPGGTKLPVGPPPPSPPQPSTPGVHSGYGSTPARSSPASDSQSNDRDFVPGERTMWELPKLNPVTEPQPAMRCNDWLHRIQPSINDLAPKAFIWWRYVMQEARDAYDRWCTSGPLERASVQGEPSEFLRSEKFVRLESRTLAMLCKALPHGIYELALSCRNTTCVGLVYLTLKAFQPGGLNERSELLKGLTSLPTAQTAASGASTIQSWFRHIERAKCMGVSIPDCSLLIEGLDKMSTPLLEKHPNLMFRMHSIRMQLQLDTVPNMPAVEQWAKSLLAEMEILAVSGSDGGSNKRTRVAAATAIGKNGKEPPPTPKAEARKSDSGAKDACKHWCTDNGCKRGRNCNFSHALEKPGKCWTCGGSHHKSECTAPGGGKGPTPEPKSKAKTGTPLPKDNPKGSGKSVAPKASSPPSPTNPDAVTALKEATHLLQSLRMARLDPNQDAIARLRRLQEAEGTRGLIDGGATSCLRTAKEDEHGLPTIAVQLAAGECELHINNAGTLLSRNPVAPIVSVAALLKLGYSITWTNQQCDISHPAKGKLEVDTSSGCPEVPARTALELIREYEVMVGRKLIRESKIRRMVDDLTLCDDVSLVKVLRSEGSEAEAALRVLLSRRLPTVSTEVLEQLVTPLQEICEGQTWNRRSRRKQARSHGLLVHLFCGKSRNAFEDFAHKRNLTHVAVDAKENLLRQSTYQHLLLQSVRGRIRFLLGGPPCRTNSVCRYFPVSDASPGPRPVRTRGESICNMDHDHLTGAEVAMRQIDDLLYLRMLALFIVASECNRCAGLADPGFAVEQPEDPECWALKDAGWRGDTSHRVRHVLDDAGMACNGEDIQSACVQF